MARMIRLTLAVAADKLADALDTMRGFGTVLVDAGGDGGAMETAGAEEEESGADAPVARRTRIAAPSMRGGKVRARTMDNRPKLYTAAGTKKQIAAALAELQEGSVGAVVLADLAKNGPSRNADVRKRLAKKVNPESIDNAIWNLVKSGRVSKEVAAEE